MSNIADAYEIRIKFGPCSSNLKPVFGGVQGLVSYKTFYNGNLLAQLVTRKCGHLRGYALKKTNIRLG
jgi:hypothetical protein